MSDSKKKPKIPPPDDFSKTTPNVNINDELSDWDKTNFDIPSQTPADDWGKTVINYDVSELDDNDDDDDASEDFGNTHYSNNSPKEPDWGMTQANVNIGNVFEEEKQSGSGNSDEADYGATTPYFKLPEAEREKYQNIPPTPTQKAQQEEKEQKEKGGVPMWFWASAALMTMFTFAVFLLLGAWYIFLNEKGFTLVVNGAPLGSKFYVDGSEWGLPSEKNKHFLNNLEAGKRKILVTHPNFTCVPQIVDGKDGKPEEIIPDCKPSAPISTEVKADCEKTLDEKTRESCSEDILDKLGNPPNLDDLLKALNLLRINFATGKSNIPERNKRILTKAAGHIKNLPQQVVIEIGGHTDNVGTDKNNQGLSERRASAVRKFLISLGVKETRLTEKGYGEAKPEADNNTTEGRARNRRIEYTAVKR